MKITTIISGILFFATQQVFLASAQIDGNRHSTLSGNIIKEELPDSILLMKYPQYNFWDTSDDNSIMINIDKKFHFQFPKINQPILYSFTTVKNNNVTNLGEFYAESSDKIQVVIYNRKIKSGYIEKDSTAFSGKGSEKYNLIEGLNKIFAKSYSEIQSYSPPTNLKDSVLIFLNSYNQAAIQYKTKTSSYIATTKGVSTDMKTLINHEFAQNNINLFWAAAHKLVYDLAAGDISIQKIIRNNFNRNYNNLIDVKPDEMTLLSPRYYQSTNAILKHKLAINESNGIVDLKMHYDLLKELYSGKFREKILSELFKGAYGMSDLSNISSVYDSLVKDSQKYLTSMNGKAIIDEKLKFKMGTKLFDSEFIDLNGNKFNFSSLRGKVFLLETWGLGCSVCAGFHAIFEKELWPMLKNRKDFEVLSIYDGKTKSNWQKGIDSRLYTSTDYLNVSNMPFGNSNHPFFKYYEVNFAPFFLLVDKKGCIISAFRADIQLKELLAMINNALDTPNTTK